MNRLYYLAMVFVLFAMVTPVGLAQISDPYNNKIFNRAITEHGQFDKKAFKQFCQEYFAGVLDYFAKVADDNSDLYETAVHELISLYYDYRDMSEDEDAEDTKKFITYKADEFRSWQIGQEIRQLREAMLSGENDSAQKDIERKEAELVTILEKQYMAKLEYQKKEFEEMRRELLALENALKKRAALKDQIIRRRVLELTGDDDVMDWD